jgi:methylmalonyl-CoA mutase
MTDQPDALPLAAEFPPATREQWLALVERLLKGAPVETLTAHSADGIRIEPLYPRSAEASAVTGRRAGAPWQVMARVDHPDAAAAHAQAADELDGGANGLVLVGAGAVGAHGFGLAPTADIEKVLEGVQLDAGIAIEFDLSPQTKDLPLALAELVKRRGLSQDKLDIRFGFDPLGASIFNGGFPMPWPQFGPLAAKLARDLADQGFRRTIVASDGRIVHGAGGTEAQELAYALAVAVAYLRAFEAAGVAVDDARRLIFFRLAADTDQFLTIAKFRALRKLWARVEQSCGLAPESAFVSAETAWRTMTRNDPATNILRATIATAAAGIGGADAITVLPFTAARGLADAFARRVARNTQLILIHEANLARLADPTAGAGWSEALSEELCRAAWSLFQEIERAGGAAAAFARGLIQRKVLEARAARERAVATRIDALVGANIFPDLGETQAAVLNVARTNVPPMPVAIAVERLTPMRLTEPYEALRDASDRVLASSGMRPRVFFANLGRPADFSARTTFARNFFETGGIEVVSSESPVTLATLKTYFEDSRAKLACLCGSDESYTREGSAAAKQLRDAGARGIYITAETPRSDIAADATIHAGCDAVAILRGTLANA